MLKVNAFSFESSFFLKSILNLSLWYKVSSVQCLIFHICRNRERSSNCREGTQSLNKMFCSHSLLSNCIHSKSLSFFCYLFSLFEGVKVEIEEGNPSSLVKLKLRYFTPREIANLHGFPSTFHFPPSFSLKQCFSLLGNSLNVVVVSELIDYLLLEWIFLSHNKLV